MLVPFDTLPNHARVWVYQSNRAFQPREEEQLALALASFCHSWAAHQVPLRASFHVSYHHFIVLAADETLQPASGCSIDSSVQMLQRVQQPLGLDLFDRRQAAFLVDGAVVLHPVAQVAKQLAAGTLQESTLYFNNLVADMGSWRNEWLQPIGRSWLQRYLTKPLTRV